MSTQSSYVGLVSVCEREIIVLTVHGAPSVSSVIWHFYVYFYVVNVLRLFLTLCNWVVPPKVINKQINAISSASIDD